MIFISTALHCEAKPFIDVFSLKRDNSINKFQVFKNEDMVLIVTGTGCINAACACTYIISEFKGNQYDTFINIGICGSINENVEIGRVIICNKIIDNVTKREFYPDMILRHPFMEGSIESFGTVMKKNKIEGVSGDFVDMEAAGFFQAVSIFFPPHRIFSIKIVSDYLDTNDFSKDSILGLIDRNKDNIVKWIDGIKTNSARVSDILSQKDMDYINEISINLKLSVYMKNKLKKISENYKVRKDNLILALEPFSQIYCESKQEGKLYFEGLVKQLEIF